MQTEFCQNSLLFLILHFCLGFISQFGNAEVIVMSDTCCLESSFTWHKWSESQVHSAAINEFLCGDDFILPCYFWVLFCLLCWWFFVYVGTMKPLQ